MLQFVSFSRINLAYSDVTLNLLFQVVLCKNVRLSFNLLIDSLKFRIFQGLFTVQLSMYSQRYALSLEVALQLPSDFFHLTRCCHLSATAYLLYHGANRLSTTFLFSFASFFQKPLSSVLLVLRDNSFIISCIEAYVNNFFRKKLNNSYLQIKRRRRDLNPRAG